MGFLFLCYWPFRLDKKEREWAKVRELEREVWVWELLPRVAVLVNGSG